MQGPDLKQSLENNLPRDRLELTFCLCLKEWHSRNTHTDSLQSVFIKFSLHLSSTATNFVCSTTDNLNSNFSSNSVLYTIYLLKISLRTTSQGAMPGLVKMLCHEMAKSTATCIGWRARKHCFLWTATSCSYIYKLGYVDGCHGVGSWGQDFYQ